MSSVSANIAEHVVSSSATHSSGKRDLDRPIERQFLPQIQQFPSRMYPWAAPETSSIVAHDIKVQYGGSGLGLFIPRELTELQGGEIGVSSIAGEGSTFAFYIKGRRSPNVREEVSNRPFILSSRALSATEITAAFASALPTPVPDTPMRTPRIKHSYHILLVEDNLIDKKVLSKQLRKIGCTVHVANHGVEALDFIKSTTLWIGETPAASRNELSVILMDLEMPIMCGLTCTRRIRDLEREGKLKCRIPIIAVTANARSEQMDRATEAGMDDIVPKPFRIPELIQKTDQLMASRMLGQREQQEDYFS